MAKKATTEKSENAGRKVAYKTVVKTSSNIKFFFESVTTTNKELSEGGKLFDDNAEILSVEKNEDGSEIVIVNFEFSKDISNLTKINTVNGYGFKEI